MTGSEGEHGLREFMNRGGFWRFLAFMIVYLAIYEGAGWAVGQIAPDAKDADVLSSIGSVFVQITFALIVGAIVLVGFARYLGWTETMFGRQPIYRSRWMWIGVALALLPIVLRALGIDWGKRPLSVVALMLGTGLMIGFVEELVYRGFAVKMLRDGGHGEWAVAALASLAFALSHSINLFTGQAIGTVGVTIVYTFAFGVLMYLTLRVTGFLIWAMLLHGLTDPTTFLASGGVDKVSTDASSNVFLDLAGTSTFVIIAGGFILLIFIRGKVAQRHGAAREHVA